MTLKTATQSVGEAMRPAMAAAIALCERWRSGVGYNPLSARTVQNPYPVYAALRARSPAHRSTLLNAWLFTRHADVDAILRDHRRFGSDPRKGRLSPRQRALLPPADEFTMLLLDPPDHTRLTCRPSSTGRRTDPGRRHAAILSPAPAGSFPRASRGGACGRTTRSFRGESLRLGESDSHRPGAGGCPADRDGGTLAWRAGPQGRGPGRYRGGSRPGARTMFFGCAFPRKAMDARQYCYWACPERVTARFASHRPTSRLAAIVAARCRLAPALLGRDIAAADAHSGRPAFSPTTTAALAVGKARRFGSAPGLARRPRPGLTGAVGGEAALGARRALGTLRERRGPAALDAQAGGPALGVLPAVAFAVGATPRFGIANRLALGPEAFGAGAVGGPGLLAAGRADVAPGRGRALAALDAQTALPALGDAPVVARQLALPPLG